MTRRGREHERTDEERAQVADELRRVRESVRERALLERDPSVVLPEPRPVRAPEAVPTEAPAAPESLPARPDAAAVNALWEAAPPPAPGGLRGWLVRALDGLLGGRFEAQRRFNAQQVQLDNALLAYVDARLAATHRHYDGVLGGVGRHLGEVDERHMILQEELVAHVHDLVKRIDLVLAEAERGRVSAEHALKDLRQRVKDLEERLTSG
ncbi:MAG TPA: hypothetical protein VI589_15595 [Vicinamibacteria bacterium]